MRPNVSLRVFAKLLLIYMAYGRLMNAPKSKKMVIDHFGSRNAFII